MKIKIFGKTVSLVQCKDRWYNKDFYVKELPPWAKERMGRQGLSMAQMKVTDAFAEIQEKANKAGLNRWQRRELTAKVLRGKSFGGKPRPPRRAPAPKETVESAISEAQAIVARYAVS